MVEVTIIPALTDNYVYLFDHDSKAIVIDPSDASSVLRALEAKGLKLKMILNTHHHFDHVGGNETLKKETGCRVVGPDEEGIPGVNRVVHDGDNINIGAFSLKVIATPGHTRKHVCYYMVPTGAGGPGSVWTGDTLFLGGCGRMFEGTPKMMWDSLMKLAALPDDTRVYCAHEYTVENYEFAASIEAGNRTVEQRLNEVKQMRRESQPTPPSTIGLEKRTNPFMRAETTEMKRALGMNNASAVEVFAELRRRKDLF
jgi:hydroxyacylglutathione hydrolase